MSTEVREGLCYRRNPASQRTGKWKSHASGYSFFLLYSYIKPPSEMGDPVEP